MKIVCRIFATQLRVNYSKPVFFGLWDNGGAAEALIYAMPLISQYFTGKSQTTFGECREKYLGRDTGAQWELFVVDNAELKRLGLKNNPAIMFYDADAKKIVGKVDTAIISPVFVKNSLFNLFQYGTQYGTGTNTGGNTGTGTNTGGNTGTGTNTGGNTGTGTNTGGNTGTGTNTGGNTGTTNVKKLAGIGLLGLLLFFIKLPNFKK